MVDGDGRWWSGDISVSIDIKTYINCKNIYASIHIYIEIYTTSKLETDEATIAISTKRKNNIKSHRCLNLLA